MNVIYIFITQIIKHMMVTTQLYLKLINLTKIENNDITLKSKRSDIRNLFSILIYKMLFLLILGIYIHKQLY
jgi:hypothetical protein